ncbi:Cytochrome b561 [Usitatibacter rugosus]|uniref:Cytochrome b561 n=1 Tax=Usitatibacter rugosus TaxID=2732067 RepID=A0A6M4GXF0_9PROT|nr:cytochrome b [Usitatibacter rugosus]QJR11063.1 Cytochrome b561 [Usitatibacter rugosus]
MNYTERYTRTAIALHWIAAVLILGNLAWGLYMVSLEFSPAKLKYYSWHKWTGVTIFVLAAARLLWRLKHPAPPLPAHMPVWESRAAHASHILLYVLFFAGPLTGWLFSSAGGFQTVYFGVLPIPDLLGKDRELADVLKVVHRSTVYALGGLIALHAAAAVKHHVIDRDDVLTRMLPFLKPRPPAPTPTVLPPTP